MCYDISKSSQQLCEEGSISPILQMKNWGREKKRLGQKSHR